MYKQISNSLKIHFKTSFLKALSASFIFLFIHLFSNTEWIRENVEDFSFDLVNKFFISHFNVETNSPDVKLFAVDEKYLKSENLLNEYNERNYGYIFPRDKIAQFIKRLDTHISHIKENTPKVLFIDYDMSYKTSNYNRQFSKEDELLLEVLKIPREYIIMFPKTLHQNIIENSGDQKISDLIKNGKIQLVSVGLTVSSDNMNRRYHPYKEFENRIYLNAPISIYNLYSDNPLKSNDFELQSVIENRIVYRDYNKIELNNSQSFLQSNWLNLRKYSAHYPLNLVMNESFQDSIIIFGSSYIDHDIFQNNSLLNNPNLNGIDIHANTIITLFWLDGRLEKINIFIGIILIFLIFFILDMLIEMFFDFFNSNYRNVFEFIVLLILSALILLFISTYLLNNYNIWFNWIVPFIIYQFLELIELFKFSIIVQKITTKGKK